VAVCDLDSRKGEKAVRDLQAEYGVDRAIFIKTDVTNTTELEGNLTTLLKKIRHVLETLVLSAKLFSSDEDGCEFAWKYFD
jgi:hypothetical protein